ncbi:hypothetical protein M405DRAFT_836693 [Rhizopogon salebrosus TDB-379]|nr:hypothetical protein M405DRAFT_836693 [Rhizopogon salebrosus TDB-379]
MKQEFKSAKKGDSFGLSWVWQYSVLSLVLTYVPVWRRATGGRLFSRSLPAGNGMSVYNVRRGFELDESKLKYHGIPHGVPLQGITSGYGGDRREERNSAEGCGGWLRLFFENKALVTVNKIMNAFKSGDAENVHRMRGIAEDVFGKGWQAKGDKIYKEGPTSAQVFGISYCHIDTAWLWPYSVTQQKTARSWSTQIDLMERYPEHRFACSQAQQFKWLEEQYPPLFERIKKKVASGQFHLIGGSWVENDGNMPSGEALVRQFLYAYLQLIREAGMKSLFRVTIRQAMLHCLAPGLVWTHRSVLAIDQRGGHEVLFHTEVELVVVLTADEEKETGSRTLSSIGLVSMAPKCFGNGDGGGGALAKILENLRRIRAASNEHRELPSVSMGSTVQEFFEDIEKDSKEGTTLPVWGTYTSHGSIEKGNRKSEILLRDAKLEFTPIRSTVHDVLPGSSIGMVCDDAEKLYAEVREVCTGLLEEAFSSSDMLLTLKVQVVQAPPDSKYGYALMHSRGNGIVMQPMGMFANRAPASDHFILKNEHPANHCQGKDPQSD